MDACGLAFVKSFVAGNPVGIDVVVSNPPFELAIPFLEVAQEVIRDISDGRIVFLLPSDFFVASKQRKEWYLKSPLYLLMKLDVGRWSYSSGDKRPKRTGDAIFLFGASDQMVNNTGKMQYECHLYDSHDIRQAYLTR
jgi:hypothetical protein